MARPLMWSCVFAISLLALLFAVFVAAKLDEHIHWRWSAVFWPLWTLDALMFLASIAQFVSSVRSSDDTPVRDSRDYKIAAAVFLGQLFTIGCTLWFMVWLAQVLSGTWNQPFMIVCIPLFVWLGMATLVSGLYIGVGLMHDPDDDETENSFGKLV